MDQALAAKLGLRFMSAFSDADVEMKAQGLKNVGITKLQELREALTIHKRSVPEFVSRCRREIWPATSSSSEVPKGLCIAHLGLLLTSLQGTARIVEYLQLRGVKTVQWNLDRQVAIAKEVAAKYTS